MLRIWYRRARRLNGDLDGKSAEHAQSRAKHEWRKDERQNEIYADRGHRRDVSDDGADKYSNRGAHGRKVRAFPERRAERECPACRREYSDEAVQFKPINKEE